MCLKAILRLCSCNKTAGIPLTLGLISPLVGVLGQVYSTRREFHPKERSLNAIRRQLVTLMTSMSTVCQVGVYCSFKRSHLGETTGLLLTVCRANI